MAFQFASTNLVVELGVILAVLIGWQFTAGEFVGGPIMIVLMALLFRRFLTPRLVAEAPRAGRPRRLGRMEGHAEMDMSVAGEGSLWRRLRSPAGLHRDQQLLRDGLGGGLDGRLRRPADRRRARGVGARTRSGRASSSSTTARWPTIWGPLIGPLVAMLSFVCSIGNVPLAAVLWNGGISFGGVLAFIFADLIILPILNIYRKYYGRRVAAFLLVTFYATMAASGLIVDLLFKALGLEPTGPRHAKVIQASVTLDYTTVLNIVFLALAAVLLPLLPQGRRARDAPDDEHADGRGTPSPPPWPRNGDALCPLNEASSCAKRPTTRSPS